MSQSLSSGAQSSSDGRQVVVKMYRRGLLVRCRGLITCFRAQREFDGLSQLEKLGIPCSVPLFWCHGHFGPYGWAEILVTEWVARSQSLRDLLVTRPEASRSLDLSPLFADMAMMHAAGLHHGMLRTKNILVKDYPESAGLCVHRFAAVSPFSAGYPRQTDGAL